MSFIQKMEAGCSHLIIAGDAAQSIYGIVPVFNERPANKSEIGNSIQPVVKPCSMIYRLTKSVINVIKNVFVDLIRDKTYNGKEDSEIRLYKAEDIVEETLFCWNESEMINQTRPSEINAILIYKRDHIVYFVNEVLKSKGKEEWIPKKIKRGTREEYDFDSLNNHLAKSNIPLMYVGSKHGSLEEADQKNKVVIMTYHSAKGLDFDAVCLPYIQVDLSVTANEEALMLVALSRAKRDLFITFTGSMYSGYERFLNKINPTNISSSESDEGEVLF